MITVYLSEHIPLHIVQTSQVGLLIDGFWLIVALDWQVHGWDGHHTRSTNWGWWPNEGIPAVDVSQSIDWWINQSFSVPQPSVFTQPRISHDTARTRECDLGRNQHAMWLCPRWDGPRLLCPVRRLLYWMCVYRLIDWLIDIFSSSYRTAVEYICGDQFYRMLSGIKAANDLEPTSTRSDQFKWFIN